MSKLFFNRLPNSAFDIHAKKISIFKVPLLIGKGVQFSKALLEK